MLYGDSVPFFVILVTPLTASCIETKRDGRVLLG
jgi:hypothetical protein